MELDQPPSPDSGAKKSEQRASEAYAAALEHRSTLARLAEQSQSDYDKAVMTLSGGALGVSFGYLKEVAGSPPFAYSGILLLAWGAWTLSVTSCLFSLAISGVALRREIDKTDRELLPDKSDTREEPKGRGGRAWDTITCVLNWAGGILFALGASAMIGFVILNQHERHPAPTTSTSTTATNTPTKSGSGPTATSQHGSASATPTAQPTAPGSNP